MMGDLDRTPIDLADAIKLIAELRGEAVERQRLVFEREDRGLHTIVLTDASGVERTFHSCCESHRQGGGA